KIHLGSSLKMYKRTPSDLARVNSESFVGVTSVKQPDGSERATNINIFPEELRGIGEGSYLMNPNPAQSASSSRMTNGTVARAAACAKATADGQRWAGSAWRARATTSANSRGAVGRSQFTGMGGATAAASAARRRLSPRGGAGP